MKDPVYVFGHRRSGNHFLIETIRLNFGITPLKHHGDFERVRSVIGSHRCLSIVRDGRDVLGSSFFWWLSRSFFNLEPPGLNRFGLWFSL